MNDRWTRREFVQGSAALMATGLSAPAWAAFQPPSSAACVVETDYLRYAVGRDGRNVEFTDKQTGTNFCDPSAPCAQVRRAAQAFPATAVNAHDGKVEIDFGEAGVKVVLQIVPLQRYLRFEVLSVAGAPVDELVFVNIPLKLNATPDEAFAACALALNLRANVLELPRANRVLRATCYSQLGTDGASSAVVGCPTSELRQVLQQAVSDAPDLPHSTLGGPWALDQPINRGSYLFNFDGITEQTVDRWIELAKSLGLSQIDFHGGHSFRFGDLRPHPDLYPQGDASLKVVIDRLHAAGIAAGLHTYAFFIDKRCPWVTPIADPRLAKSATFTLAADVSPQDATIPVMESTAAVSTITGFFVRNSVTVRIGQELVVFTGVAPEPPYGFRGCQRGAYGTAPAAHSAGTRVDHLKECFGLFAPDPDSTLLTEVAARTAEAFNRCGFDMIYLDALDGSDVLDPFAGGAFAWHYGARFVYEICRRLERPPLMEMSTFHHHLWCIRSRYCAWDHPSRSYKKFIDLHCADNEDNRRMFLPGELGWWALKSWTGPQVEPTYSDDIEYLMAKALGTDTGFALMGIDPNNAQSIPALPRLGAIVKRYEDLRHAQRVPESVKAQLRTPGAEFTLAGDLERGWEFRPAKYARHQVADSTGPTSRWQTANPFGPQPLRLRIAALMAAGAYDQADAPVLADFASEDFPTRNAQKDVSAQLVTSREVVQAAEISGRLSATSNHPNPKGAWVQVEKKFSPPLNLTNHQALGLWVHGDGQGQLLNLQLRSPHHLAGGIGDHYIAIDFEGWRYFELIEPEGERHADYAWPYGGLYAIYRESVQFGQVESLGLWLNNLPVGQEVCCHIGPIKALPLVSTRLIRPALSVGGKTIVFPLEIESGQYLEFHSSADCRLYGPQGQLVRAVPCEGEVPTLAAGENAVQFTCESPTGTRARAEITLISQGDVVS